MYIHTHTHTRTHTHTGNLPINVGLTPEALKQFVNTVMQQMFLTVKPGEPVIDSFVSGDGKFGFVEMRTIQEATNALSMTGADCFGRPIRVGKPADYVPPDAQLIQAAMGSGLLGTPGDEGVGEFAQGGPDLSKVGLFSPVYIVCVCVLCVVCWFVCLRLCVSRIYLNNFRTLDTLFIAQNR
jgi:hypothetical protein